MGLTAVVAALGITATLTGCGSLGSSDEVTLRVVAADYGDNPGNSSTSYWNNLAKTFEDENPGIKVDVSVYSWEDVDAEVAAMDKAGQAPDIAQIGAYADYAADDKLYSADELLSVATQADFLRPLSEAGQVRRVQYGMPFVASTRLLFYNTELFDEAGIKSPPTTWDELQRAARKLRSVAKYPFALPLGNEEAQAETMMWLLSGGGGYTDLDDAYTIDSPENIKTLTWLKNDLVGEDLTGPVAPGKLNRQEAFDAFSRGEVGMLNGHPTLMKQAEAKGVKFAMVPMPGAQGNEQAAVGVADWIMAFKNNGHRVEAGKFLDFVYAEQNVTKFTSQYGLLPVTTSGSRAMAETPGNDELKKFLQALPTSRLYPVGKKSWAKVSENVKLRIGKAVTPNGSPESVLTQISQEAEAAESAE
ncbi:extracellular solute-binding protein [Streptomyces sp. A3M-1-3]|uniref:extracellular solute-binding protein n=1 Tax=Streptomyces sp. A3M-1-3 TaxID=2962044 RepID=UPI0035AB81F5